MEIDHADIVVTHDCMNHCRFCIDKFVHSSTKLVETSDIHNFLDKIQNVTDKKIEVLLLGGEPSIIQLEKIVDITNVIKSYNYSPIISTNNPNKEKIISLLPYFDWIQVTIHSEKDIDFYREYKDKINIKLAGDKNFNLDRLNWFIDNTADFERKSISMYFTPDFKELCDDKLVWDLYNTLDWTRNGSYLYTFYKGVRIKRCIVNKTNIIDEPTVPKLYPNGNYNKTWLNENLDDYLSIINK